jgi:hypothetical protein
MLGVKLISADSIILLYSSEIIQQKTTLSKCLAAHAVGAAQSGARGSKS